MRMRRKGEHDRTPDKFAPKPPPAKPPDPAAITQALKDIVRAQKRRARAEAALAEATAELQATLSRARDLVGATFNIAGKHFQIRHYTESNEFRLIHLPAGPNRRPSRGTERWRQLMDQEQARERKRSNWHEARAKAAAARAEAARLLELARAAEQQGQS